MENQVIVRRKAKTTLSAIELHHGDKIEFTLVDDRIVVIEVIDSSAEIMETTLKTPGQEESYGKTTYRFWADFEIDGTPIRLEREVGTQQSFYQPWEIDGLWVWLDAVDAAFSIVNETHGRCRLQENCSHHLPKRRHVRLALQDIKVGLCPEPIYAWCPLPVGGLRIEDCYRGEDCWLGAYDGASAHGGLDINHPKRTPLYAPIDIDRQFLYNSTQTGYNNNRWRGLRYWTDGSVWILTSCHMVDLTVAEHTSLKAGQQYANGAGVWVGVAEHTHFGFTVLDHGELIQLDPWILFWQMYRDQGIIQQADATGTLGASIL